MPGVANSAIVQSARGPVRTCVRDRAGGAYSQFKRALKGRQGMQAWTLAAELPKVPLADGLELLLLARDLEPARFDRAVPRWHAGSAPNAGYRQGRLSSPSLPSTRYPGRGLERGPRACRGLRASRLDREVQVLEWGIDAQAV
jgi:hypothetical protein